MKQIMILAALVAAFAGCTSATHIEWGGRKAVRDADGAVIKAPDGSPYYESEKNIYKDSNWLTKREERDVKVEVQPTGAYTASLGSRVNDVSTNGIAMVTGGVGALTKLVSTCAAAYVTIAGGAQADATTAIVSKIVKSFADKGGNTEKATVTTDSTKNTLKVSDGSTCVECDAAGNCTYCEP
jgi:hypothetical protein